MHHLVLSTSPSSHARATEFTTRNGTTIQTPIFMPVATQAALRGVDLPVVAALDYQVLLANTYHLMLRPGIEIFRKFGGIHKFMNWPRAVLTDSGGFQIFSLSKQLKITEEGALCKSYVDRSQFLLSPERSIEMQQAIGSDIMMVLDHCISSTSSREETRAALELTSRWAARCLVARGESTQALFGIVQGASFEDLRRESAAQICALPFDGFAIGGLAVGETKSAREDLVELTAPLLPADKPRYLMGVGTPIDLLEAVKRGIDMFDCILPTSFAQQGVAFTSRGKVDLRRGVYRDSTEALDVQCGCSTCARYTRAYLHHIFNAGEFIGAQLVSIHNLTFYRELMRAMRESILAGQFDTFYSDQREPLAAMDLDNPTTPPKKRAPHHRMTSGDYEIIASPAGYGSIRQISSGETMHSVVDPMIEAKRLYVDQSSIVSRAASAIAPLTIWDVGLGAATNAMVCIRELESQAQLPHPILIQSFENDLDSLRLALSQPGLFKHLHHPAPHKLLESRYWERAQIQWELIEGDFAITLESAKVPEIIWFDPFSAKVDTQLWSLDTFKRIAVHCQDHATTLYTYSASTAVRAVMLAAGWYVGAGVGTGPKEETTVAYSPMALRQFRPENLLGVEWLTRWSKSAARGPLVAANLRIDELVQGHPQFDYSDYQKSVPIKLASLLVSVHGGCKNHR